MDRPTLYDRLGVTPNAAESEVKAAYRHRARELHPDLRTVADREAELEMAAINAAWHALSDPVRRAAYDATLADTAAAHPRIDRSPPPVRTPTGSRKIAWIGGIRVQIRRLTYQAARSATQTMLLRHHGRGRDEYDRLADSIVDAVSEKTPDRIRTARLAGAAPLDLALVAALIGMQAVAEQLAASLQQRSPTQDETDWAEMIDRMWETMAYELPRELVVSIGDAPKLARRIRNHR